MRANFLVAVAVLFELFTGSPAAAALTRGPYLQNGTPTSVIVRWRTDQATDSRVRFGTDPANLSRNAFDPTARREHVVTLPNLLPDTRYYYSVGGGSQIFASGPDYYFVTAPAGQKPTRIWVLGDAGTRTSSQRAVRDAYYAFTGNRHTDLWLMLGDNAYGSGTDFEYQGAVFDMYPSMLRKSVLWSTLGNHDAYSSGEVLEFPYLEIFTFPTAGEAGGVASGTEKYYSFNYGNIHFVVLDSMSSDRDPNGPMCTWLEQDLADNTKEWIIAFWHHPPYSKGSHNSDGEYELIQMRENVLPILEAYGTDLVLSGHSHAYERSYLLHGHYGFSSTLVPEMIVDNGSGRESGTGAYQKSLVEPRGAVYVVAGSSGQISGGGLNHPAMFISLNRLGSLVLDVDGRRLDATFVRENGNVDDTFTMVKTGEASNIQITSFGVDHNFMTIVWTAEAGKTYYVERATSLYSPEWERISPPIQANSDVASYGTLIEDEPTLFYRIAQGN